MHHRLSKTVALSILLVVLALPHIPAIYADQEGVPARGGVMTTTMLYEPAGFDPSFNFYWMPLWVCSQIFNPLLGYDLQWNLVPNLAESWSLSPDGSTWTFKLRKDVRWHDGVPFTSADVSFSLKDYGESHIYWIPIAEEGMDIQTPDDFTVIVKFASANINHQYLFCTSQGGIMPSHILENVPKEERPTHAFNSMPIGTGPFKFKEWVRGSHVILERNEDYFKLGLPYLDRIIIQFIPDATTVLRGIDKGDIDYAWRGLPGESTVFLATLPNINIHYLPSGHVARFLFNLNHSILGKLAVRQAIAHAIDKESIVKRATFGVCEVSDSLVTSLAWQPGPSLTIYEYNPEKAKQLLDEAGYEPGPDGIRFSFEVLNRRSEPDEVAAAEIIRDQLRNVGIDLKITVLDTISFNTFYFIKSQFDAVIMKQGEDTPVPKEIRMSFHSESVGKGIILGNGVGYVNEEFDSLLEQIFSELDEDKRKALTDQAMGILSVDIPAIPLYYNYFVVVVNNDFKGDFLPQHVNLYFDTLEAAWWVGARTTEPVIPVTTASIWALIAGVAGVVVTVVVSKLARKRKSTKMSRRTPPE